MAKPRESTRSEGKSTPLKARELRPDHSEDDQADVIDNTIPRRGYDMLPMVGLGGSAGSIQSLKAFFRAMPADSGLAFVVILHLSSEHDSTLAEVLQSSTAMPVVQVNSTAKVEANCVYVIPPGKQLASVDGNLEVADLPTHRGRRVAVDLFFRTLADTHGPHAAAIVLSGADGDGAIGIKRIKERGGLTIAQNPDEAEHPSMPATSIATGMIDWILRVPAMPERLIDYFKIGTRLKLPPEDGPPPATSVPLHAAVTDTEATLREILAFLRTHTGRDFSYYKRATILRRVGRRLQVNGLDDLPSYLAFMRTHRGEAAALLQDMLISVTNFFRDRDAFDALALQIPYLFRDKGPTDTIRAWVPGCATGEEAYSIAMLLSEHARTLEAPPKVQVFATDLDEEVIGKAREGLYPDTIAADVSEERLRRWFSKDPHGYRVRRELRESVLFALHDLLKDSPFSRIDLVSCRNLLIYLNSEAQSRAFDIFHFALRPGGRMFLGPSESVPNESRLFTLLDKKHRLYAQQSSARITLPVPVGISALTRSLDLKERWKEGPALSHNGDATAAHPALEPSANFGEVHYQLIERFAPPSIVVNAQYEVVHMSNSAGRFLQVPGGELTRNLLQLIHPMLRLDLRAALFSAMQSQMPADAFKVALDLNGERKSVDIHVAPAHDLGPTYLLVTFQAHAVGAETVERVRNAQPDAAAQHLERELERTQTQLRDTVEQSEASTEELKASNEELQAMNEELRSATEELETSREELQSINEELTTVNHELKSKVDELGFANSDLHNLMAATAIATIFLDRDLRIMRYTPPAVELFNLIPTDVGRPLSDLTHRLDYPEIESDARRALGELIPAEREVHARGRWFIARTLPYRSSDDRIGGVLFTFVDITARREAQEALRELQQEQASDLASLMRLQELSSSLLSATELPSLLKQLLDATVEMQRADFGCVQLYDSTSRELNLIAQRGFDADALERLASGGSPESASGCRAITRRERVVVSDVDTDQEYAPLRGFAKEAGYRAVHSTPLFDRNDEPLGVLTTHFREPHQPSERELRLTDLYARQAADVIALKLAEQNLRASEEGFRAMVEQTTLGVARCDFTGLITFANQRWCEMLGRTADELYQMHWQELTHPDDLAVNERMFTRLARDGNPFEMEKRFVRKDGSLVWANVSVSVLRARDGRPYSATALILDLTERNRARQASRESEERLRLVVENAREYAIFSMDLERRVTSWNVGAQRLIGFEEKEIIGKPADVIFTSEDRAAGVPEIEARTALAEGRASDERWHLRRDGTRFWGSGVMMAMHDANDRTIGLIKIFRDQTAARELTETLAHNRIELEQALRAAKIARDDLETASRAKDRFLAVLSHELRTPLTPVVMAVHMLAKRADMPEAAREALEMIRRNVKIESHLIDDLLDLTRVSRGQFEIVTEPTDLHAAITGAVEICESDIRSKSQTLTIALDASQYTTEADFTRLQQVVWNLLKNASKFTRKGGEIQLTTRNEGTSFFISVSDNGIGIDAEALPTIFDAFTQGGEWVAREYGGLGLGLAISKATVEAHGGTIKAESGGRGRGATFTVELPLS